MRNLIVLTLLVVLVCCSRGKQGTVSRIVLPNPELLGTCPTKRPQLWRDPRTGNNVIYPAMFHIDLGRGGCSTGLTAWYDKSVSLEEVRTAINQRYGKWERTDLSNSKIGLWRVESERFAMQLAELGKQDEDKGPGESGMKQLIYLPISGPSGPECDCP
jgi:hypothetical protein